MVDLTAKSGVGSVSAACRTCAHWRRLSDYRGECLMAPFTCNTYRQGVLEPTDTYEETKPDYWCSAYEARFR